MRFSTGFLTAPLVVYGLFAVTGCSQPLVDDVADASGSQTQGIVIVERTAATDGSTQTHVSAKFLRLAASADPDVAERVVGSHLELPALGECRAATSAPEEAPAARSIGSIELLDVGDVTMDSDAISVPLAARAFPDIADLVSGVFYTSRDASTTLPAPARYRLSSTGSASIERFDIGLDAPAAPEDVRIGDDALDQSPTLDTTAPIALHWRAGQAQDVVYVDLTSSSSPASVRCAFTDGGQGSIPAGLVEDAFLGRTQSVAVAVHRMRTTGFSVPGIDGGEARFDLAVVGQAALASSKP